MTPDDFQARRLELTALLAAEQDHVLRHGLKPLYILDGESVPYEGWVTVMTDRLNQLNLMLQLEDGSVDLAVPPGSV